MAEGEGVEPLRCQAHPSFRDWFPAIPVAPSMLERVAVRDDREGFTVELHKKAREMRAFY